MKVDTTGFKSSSRYDDVWSRATEICPYCAWEVDPEVEKCPHCSRSLVSWHFHYERPGANLHILWVLLAGLGQLYLINGVLDLVLGDRLPLVVLNGLLMLVFFGLAGAVYYRQAWAHQSAIVVTLVLLFLRVIRILGLTVDFRPDPADPLETLFISPVMNLVLDAVDVMQLAAMILVLLWAVLLVGPDFERKKVRQRARVDRGVRDPSGFDLAGRRHARRGEWATAVLHWQRAVAHAPANRHYHRRLGHGYARLGFLERSEDSLHTARELTADVEERIQVEQLLATVQQRRKGVAAGTNKKHE